MSKNETIADICAEMRSHGKDGEFVSGYEVGRLADRIEAAFNRLAIPTPEQWTEFARQGSELKKLREYDAKLEADFAALMKDRNALAEKNRECCDENERLHELLGYCVRFIGDAAEPLGADCETVEMIAKARAVLNKNEKGATNV